MLLHKENRIVDTANLVRPCLLGHRYGATWFDNVDVFCHGFEVFTKNSFCPFFNKNKVMVVLNYS